MNGPERRPSYNVDYQHKFFENKNGHLSAGGGASKFPGQKWQPQVGVQGVWRFKREANPQNKGSVSVGVNKPLSGPERRPSYNIDYQHNIFQNKNGQISAGGGAVKYPGQKWQPQVGVQGTWRFRREANPQKNSVSVDVNKPLTGQERRPSYNIDYQHKFFENKNGHVSAGGGASKFPGQKWQPQVGVQGVWRFKREANPQKNSVSVDVNKPLTGQERRPSYNIDYQHKFFENKNGHLSAGGGASKFPGQKWQPQVGVQGVWRF